MIVPQTRRTAASRRQGTGAAREEQYAVVSNRSASPRGGTGAGRRPAKWDYGIASSLGFDTSDRRAAVRQGLKAVGQPKLAADAWVIVAWGQILTTVKLMNKIGVNKLTSANFTKAIRAFKGPQALGAPSLQCASTRPSRPPATTGAVLPVPGSGKFKRSPASSGRRRPSSSGLEATSLPPEGGAASAARLSLQR
jgi:hypothetical protein